MMAILGEYSLYFAFFFACLQVVLPLFAYRKPHAFLPALAKPAAFLQCGFISLAFTFLVLAFVQNDFSIAYVAANSHPKLPFMYRLTAIWGAHEGSILLWVLTLNLWTVAYVLITHYQAACDALVLLLLGLISLGFLSFLLFTSNPFLPALTSVSQGRDLNPLLQDPGFVFHPPMLYLGYVGFSVAFALTQGKLIKGELNEAWATLTKQFALGAWAFLTLGIALGSWWSYRVLGWGGYWFWDPVENASLLPWLSGTALIHVLILVEKRETMKTWAILLAIITFALSILGTFLVRSGVLISAHTFASDPARGVVLLALFMILILSALLIYMIKAPHLSLKKDIIHFPSREFALLLNSGLLFVAMLIVLLGTLYPLILDAMGLGVISVGPPYFNSVMMPLLFIILLFMGIAPFCKWNKASLKDLAKKSLVNGMISIGVATLFLLLSPGALTLLNMISLVLSIWVIINTLPLLRHLPGMSLAHLGFAILVIGVLLSSFLSEEKESLLKPGGQLLIGPYQFYLLNVESVQGPNYQGVQGNFEVLKNKRHITFMQPEKRFYTVRETVMSKVSIHAGFFRDLYIALGSPVDDNEWQVRVYYKPFIRWIWLGGFIMMVGALLSLGKRRVEKGAAHD